MTPRATQALEQLLKSPALWNRSTLNLESRETLVQLLDAGNLADGRALYALGEEDEHLRGRLDDIVRAVALPTSWFWRAALASLGVAVDDAQPVPPSADM